MKPHLLLLVGILLIGCNRSQPSSDSNIYDFHTGNDGRILWRCNRKTGEADIARFTPRIDELVWIRIPTEEEVAQAAAKIQNSQSAKKPTLVPETNPETSPKKK